MSPVRRQLRLEDVSSTTPLRLSVAAEIAFPDGSISGKALQREAAHGRLEIERITGKDFTTLGAIERMRERCRVQPSHPHCTSANAPAGNPSSSFSIEAARSALAEARSPGSRG